MPKTVDSQEAPIVAGGGRAHRDLSAMIDAGRAFSGNERNCCFINTRDGRFADLSAGSGLDFPDDGRAVAVTDWDQDGDLDLWISNRNAPRLRYLRNDAKTSNHFLALQLVGDGNSTNRDAIGARVEVKLRGNSDSARLVHTLRAGEGFLSQSSKWLHFGLGSATEIDAVIVHWPGGRKEVFGSLSTDRRYLLVQDSGKAELLKKRDDSINLTSSIPPVAISGGAARVPAVTLLRFPKLNIKRGDGSQTGVGDRRFLLVNLWATWCAPCIKELGQLRDRADELRTAKLDVLALNVDGVSNTGASGQDPRKVIMDLKFPFPGTIASKPLVTALQEFHNRLVGLNQPLPVPTSFLIDPQGFLSVMYKGPVSVDQLLADLKHSSGTLDERLDHSAQISGSMIQHPEVRRSVRTHEASIHYRYGKAHQAANDPGGANYHFAKARKLDPKSVPPRRPGSPKR